MHVLQRGVFFSEISNSVIVEPVIMNSVCPSGYLRASNHACLDWFLVCGISPPVAHLFVVAIERYVSSGGVWEF